MIIGASPGEDNHVVILRESFARHHEGVPGASLLGLQHEVDAGVLHGRAHPLRLVADDRVNVLARDTIRTAARITCSSRGLPPTSCNTLGSCDFSLVPLPAAMIATATRRGPAELLFATFLDEVADERDELTFDLFIPNSIYLAAAAMAISCPVAYNLRRGFSDIKRAIAHTLEGEKNAEICD